MRSHIRCTLDFSSLVLVRLPHIVRLAIDVLMCDSVSAGVRLNWRNSDGLSPFRNPGSFPVYLALILSSFFGKFIGVGVLTASALQYNLYQVPPNISVLDLLVVGVISSISLTLSLLIADRAFEQPVSDEARLAVIIQGFFSVLVTIALQGTRAYFDKKTRRYVKYTSEERTTEFASFFDSNEDNGLEKETSENRDRLSDAIVNYLESLLYQHQY
mmetsp:Transcript_11163/g.13515  ORF Transcript_11163/g.13515 Transcript_11163/m.13515 type:complete len:215 (+) Transcript_11163:1558-2202(+)